MLLQPSLFFFYETKTQEKAIKQFEATYAKYFSTEIFMRKVKKSQTTSVSSHLQIIFSFFNIQKLPQLGILEEKMPNKRQKAFLMEKEFTAENMNEFVIAFLEDKPRQNVLRSEEFQTEYLEVEKISYEQFEDFTSKRDSFVIFTMHDCYRC